MVYLILSYQIWHIRFILDSPFQKMPDVAFSPKPAIGISFLRAIKIHLVQVSLELRYQY